MTLRMIFSWKYGTKTKPRPKLAFFKVVTTALKLHADMYRSVFSNAGPDPAAAEESDIAKIKRFCCEGLRDEMVTRIKSRPSTQSTRWEIKNVRPHLTTRVVSNRATPLPRSESAIRQAVVKIRSKQRVLRFELAGTSKGEMVEGTDKWANVVEYMVIQRRIIDGLEEPWKVWGTAEETPYHEVLKWKAPRETQTRAIAN